MKIDEFHRLVDAFNVEEIDIESVKQIIKEQVARNDVSPMLRDIADAMLSGNEEAVTFACHKVRSTFDYCQWRYAEDSRIIVRSRDHV